MKNVKIILNTVRSADGERETDNFTYDGRYDIKNGAHYLTYCEVSDGVKINTVIKATDDCVLITRTGGTGSRMKIEKGATHKTDYTTPYGVFTLYVSGLSVKNNLSNGELWCEYTLGTAQGEISRNTIELKIKEV